MLNQGSEYTFDAGNRKSIIDVTVANRFAIEKWNLDDWKVEKGESFSDHKYISFSGGSFVPQKTVMKNPEQSQLEPLQGITGHGGVASG